jgi:peptidyl-prolyl cis-trans isomerase C
MTKFTNSVLPGVMVLLTLAATAQVSSHAPTLPIKPATASNTSSSFAVSGKPVARVNGAVLTDRDLLREMMNLFPYGRQHGGRFPKELEAGIRSQAMQMIIFEELVYQEAQRRKMTVAPVKLNQALKDFRNQFDSDAEYQQYLKTEQGGDPNRFREKVRRAILIDELLTVEITRKSAVTDPELRSFYKQNLERFRKPESVSIQTISLVIPDNPTPTQKSDVRQRAEAALKQARAAKNYEEFGVLAEKISEDDWRVMMGDHKFVHRGRMPPPVEKAVFAMQPGQVSDIIEAENSFCIARVNAREESKLVSFEEVRGKLKKELEDSKADLLRQALETRLRKNAKVEEL